MRRFTKLFSNQRKNIFLSDIYIYEEIYEKSFIGNNAKCEVLIGFMNKVSNFIAE